MLVFLNHPKNYASTIDKAPSAEREGRGEVATFPLLSLPSNNIYINKALPRIPHPYPKKNAAFFRSTCVQEQRLFEECQGKKVKSCSL